MWGVAFVLESFDFINSDSEETAGKNDEVKDPYNEDTYGPISGQIMSAVKEACR